MNEIANELASLASAIAVSARELGVNNANTEMGAIELLAKELREGTIRIADALNNIAREIKEVE